MFATPLDTLASWPTPNYIDPATRDLGISYLSPILLAITTICVVVRLYTRIFVRRWFGPDDLLVLISWISSVGVTTSVAFGLRRYDWDKHIWDMRIAHLTPAAKTLYVAIILWCVASSGVRLSILCLYYRLLRQCQATNERRYLWALHGMTAVTISLLLIYLGTGIFPCVPIKAVWTFPQIPGKCLNSGVIWEAVSVINTVCEFIIALFPLIGAYTLRVDARQRWHVIGLLSLGFLVTIAGCFRSYFVWKTVHTWDITWWAAPQWICSEIEINLALICSCVAPLRPLAGRLVDRIRRFSKTLPARNLLFSTSKSYASQSTVLSTIMGRRESGNIEQRESDNIGHMESNNYEHTESGDLSHYATYRFIDLEGISLDDEVGYTVTITGPPSDQKGFFRKRKTRKTSESNGKDIDTGKTVDPEKGLQIETTTSYAVDESYKESTSNSHRRKASYQIAPEVMAHEIDEASQNLAAWGYLDTTTTNLTISQSLEQGESLARSSSSEECRLKFPPPAALGK